MNGARMRLRFKRNVTYVSVAAVIVPLLAILAPTSPAAAGEYGPPEWFPLRGTNVIGCTWSNGCDGGYHGYPALDIARNPSGSVSGDPIYAAGRGLATIYQNGSTCGPGQPSNAVRVDHGSGVLSFYHHMERFAISGPTWVDENTVIGYVGHTGYVAPCSFNHLHFSVTVGGRSADPGQLKACIGDRLTTYPAELGKPSWSSVNLWSSVRSDGTGCARSGDPFGSVDNVAGLAGNAVSVRGWGIDADAPSTPTRVHVYVDGPAGSGARGVDIGEARLGRPDVATAYPNAGNAHGFDAAIFGVSPGAHTLHFYLINAGGSGSNVSLGSRSVTVPATAQGSPYGDLNSASGQPGRALRLTGWTVDADAPTQPASVHAYIDGIPGSGTGHNLGVARLNRPDVAAAHPEAGALHGFDALVRDLPPGPHSVYLFGINAAGSGENPLIGYAVVDVPAGSPIGNFELAEGLAGGAVRLHGWTIDPDVPTATPVIHIYLGAPAGSGAPARDGGPANLHRPDVAAAYPLAGAAHGFDIVVRGIAPGTHTAYVYALDAGGGGAHTFLGSRTLTVPVTAPGSPVGNLDIGEGRPGSIRLNGWTVDPDAKTMPTRVHVYVDGPAGSGAVGRDVGLANRARDDVAAAYPGSGTAHGFDVVMRPVAPGPHVVYVYAINAAGGGENPLIGWAHVTVAPDVTPPAVSVPAVAARFTTAATIRVSWAASDAGSGVARHQLRVRRAAYNSTFSGWEYPATWQRLTSATAPVSVAAGYDHCFSARVIDHAGNASAWSGERCVARLLDDRSLTASAGWARGTGSTFYLSTVTSTTGPAGRWLSRAGARLSHVALLVTTCPSCGSVDVYVGAAKIGAVNLYAPTTAHRRTVVLPRFTYRTGTVTIRTTSAGKLVRIDGLGMST